jgi:PleD family two-component response regulator
VRKDQLTLEELRPLKLLSKIWALESVKIQINIMNGTTVKLKFLMTKHKILLVDDEENLRETISELLIYENYEVKIASNGQKH